MSHAARRIIENRSERKQTEDRAVAKNDKAAESKDDEINRLRAQVDKLQKSIDGVDLPGFLTLDDVLEFCTNDAYALCGIISRFPGFMDTADAEQCQHIFKIVARSGFFNTDPTKPVAGFVVPCHLRASLTDDHVIYSRRTLNKNVAVYNVMHLAMKRLVDLVDNDSDSE